MRKLNGNVRHSVAHWCFAMDRKTELETRDDEPMPLTTTALATGLKERGVMSLELAPASDYELLANMGMVNGMGLVAPYGDDVPPFVRGFNNPKYRETVVDATIQEIDRLAEHGFPNVIAFVGFDVDPGDRGVCITLEAAKKSCVTGLTMVANHAKTKKVTVCLEHLSTRDISHPMKGHPGYQGDNLDFVASIVREVNHPNVRLLFDIYHVQVMHGDIIRRLQENMGIIGHIHTAGNPGRCEIGTGQEISYRQIMREIVELKYRGFVGHEHIPEWDDKWQSINNSVYICDV